MFYNYTALMFCCFFFFPFFFLLSFYVSTFCPFVFLRTCLLFYLSSCLPAYMSTCLLVYLSMRGLKINSIARGHTMYNVQCTDMATSKQTRPRGLSHLIHKKPYRFWVTESIKKTYWNKYYKTNSTHKSTQKSKFTQKSTEKVTQKRKIQ